MTSSPSSTAPWTFNAPEIEPFAGSLQGKDPKQVELIAREYNPMRILNRWLCRACDYRWQSPGRPGPDGVTTFHCPKCHSDALILVDSDTCMARRV